MKTIIGKCAEYLEAQNFTVTENQDFSNGAFSSDLYAYRKLRVVLGLIPHDDHYFFHDVTGRNNKDTIADMHSKARDYINSQYKTPKALRLKVPSIVSIFFSGPGFAKDAIDFALQNPPRSPIGGEFNLVYLIDLSQKKLISHGTSTTYSDGLQFTFSRIDPINRNLYTMREMCATCL